MAYEVCRRGILFSSIPLVRLSIHPSVCPFVHPSVCLYVIPTINPFCNQVLLQSFLITYNSAATDQKLFIFGIGIPGRVLFHFTSMNPWVMPQGSARRQNLGHPSKVVYCSLFIQTTSHLRRIGLRHVYDINIQCNKVKVIVSLYSCFSDLTLYFEAYFMD